MLINLQCIFLTSFHYNFEINACPFILYKILEKALQTTAKGNQG